MRLRPHLAMGWLAAAMFAAAVGGCETVPEGAAAAPAAGPLPSLTDIRPPEEWQPRPQAGAIPPAQGIAAFQIVELPLDRSTDEAWEVVDEEAFPAITRGAWNANGLRVGLLPVDHLRTFIGRLPPARPLRNEHIVGSAHPMPMMRTPPLRGMIYLNLTVPPMALKEQPVTGGRLQLLARLVPNEQGRLVMDLLPHHYVPRLTLLPRDPLEQELDGRIYDELGLRTAVPRSQLLVLGLFRPWPEGATGDGEMEGDVPEMSPEELARELEQQISSAREAAERTRVRVEGQLTEDAAPAAEATAADAPPLPDHLGRALLVRGRGRRATQWLLLISVEPLPQAAATEPAAP